MASPPVTPSPNLQTPPVIQRNIPSPDDITTAPPQVPGTHSSTFVSPEPQPMAYSEEDAVNILLRQFCRFPPEHDVYSELKDKDMFTTSALLCAQDADFEDLLISHHICSILKLLRNWMIHLAYKYDTIPDPAFWLNFCSTATYVDFMRYNLENPLDVKQKSTPRSSKTTPAARPQRDLLYEWNRGHRRDKSNYPVLKSERDFDRFHRKFVLQAHADNLQHLLDPNWTCSTPEEQELDDAQNVFFSRSLRIICTGEYDSP